MIKSVIYNRLPDPIKPLAKRGYYQLTTQQPPEELHSEFVNDFFDSESEYNRYIDEFEQGPATQLRDEALQEYQKLTEGGGLSDIGLGTARDYYALVRKLEPTTIVETGVCNGISTLSILLALRENESGRLYSIDYPYRANESLEEFRKETFKGYGGAAIPNDKDPGWIIPDELKFHWDLIIGKSQRELPRLITELETLDLFAHDSEHSHPCMMFEFELVFEWMDNEGVIVSDDISWNSAFSVFTEVRKLEYGKLANNVGYMRKTNDK